MIKKVSLFIIHPMFSILQQMMNQKKYQPKIPLSNPNLNRTNQLLYVSPEMSEYIRKCNEKSIQRYLEKNKELVSYSLIEGETKTKKQYLIHLYPYFPYLGLFLGTSFLAFFIPFRFFYSVIKSTQQS